jgi:hypothetical protein
MKKYFSLLSLLLSILLVEKTTAQVFWTEDFSGTNAWNLNVVMSTEGSDPNFFVVSDAEGGGITPNLGTAGSCGVANNGNNTLHVTSSFNPLGGASYDAGGLCGLFTCPMTNRRAESPIINCTGKSNMTLSFNYILNGQGNQDHAVLWFTSNGFATNIAMPVLAKTLTGCGGQGLWTSFSCPIPSSLNNNPNVQFAIQWFNNDDGIGTDPSFAIDDITISGTPSNTITTVVNTSNVCPCSNYAVTYNSSALFVAGNIFTAELSDATGNFNSPTIIGTLSSLNPNGTINCTIPCNVIPGNGYRIRVVSSNIAITGSDNGSNILINSSTPTQMFLTQTPAGFICQNTMVTYLVSFLTPALPSISWKKNGALVASNTNSYSTNIVNGDEVICKVVYSGTCPNPSEDSIIAQYFNIPPPPNVGILANPSNVICAGDSVALSGTGANTYNWFGGVVNGQTFAPTATTTYSVIGVDANGCTNTASTVVTVLFNNGGGINISSNPVNVIAGNNTTYTASLTPSNISSYQINWYRNNQYFSTTTAPLNSISFTPSGLQDSVFAWFTPNGCYTPDSFKSNTILVKSPESINDFNWPSDIRVFPNPGDQELNIEGLKMGDRITLSDLSGRIIYDHKPENGPQLVIPVGSCSNGLYIISLYREARRLQLKFTIQH